MTHHISDEQLKKVYEEVLGDLQKIAKAEEDITEKEKEEEKKEMGTKTEKNEADPLENNDEELHEILEGEDEEEYTYEELKADYASLPEETLKLHYLAAKEALVQKIGTVEENVEAPEEKPAPQMVEKSEKSKDSQKLQKMEKKLELIQKSLEKMVSLPLGRKAVTEFSSLQKNQVPSKEMTRGEAMAKIKSIISSPELTKSDRDLINKFCVGSIDQSQIGHLLRK
jgi:hypothetical protein